MVAKEILLDARVTDDVATLRRLMIEQADRLNAMLDRDTALACERRALRTKGKR
jgi:nitrogen-specific signal transduction histidine kinase